MNTAGVRRLLAVISFVLAVVTVVHGQVPDLEDLEPEDEIVSDEESIVLEPRTKDGRETSFDIRDDIRRGQEFLKDKVAGYAVIRQQKRIAYRTRKGKKKERVIVKTVIRPNFVLAVEDLTGRKIREVRINGDRCVTQGFEAIKTRGTGVGSRFEIRYPENMAVLALRTVVRSEKNIYREVVYTPYSPEIDTREVRRTGLNYLAGQIAEAHSDLKSRKVSLDRFDRLGEDITATELALVLSIIEHIDPVRFTTCPAGKEINLAREVLAIIGANTTNAYAHSKSPAGARGLFQFVPDTYRRIRAKYPGAGLKKEFVQGCNDHVNAAKASLLLFNADLAGMPRSWGPPARQTLKNVGMYLAAAYNCGLSRLSKSVKRCGAEWTCRLPEETKIYLRKFDVVWNMRNTLDQ